MPKAKKGMVTPPMVGPAAEIATKTKAKEDRFSDAIIAGIASKLDGILDFLASPEQQMLRFFKEIQDGMPPELAAYYYLHLEPDEYRALEESNSTLRLIVRTFLGHVAGEQFKKVVKGSENAALKWLSANFKDVWGTKATISIEDMRKAIEGGSNEDILGLAGRVDPEVGAGGSD